MVCVVVCADRGAPGATTAALALGTAWPTPGPALVVEADPYGGAIPLRCNTTRRREWVPESPTVLAAAAAAVASRGVPSGEVVTQYAHRFSDRVQVVVGHRVAEQARGISDWGPLGQALRAVGGPVIVDVGRIHAASPSMKIAASAHIVVLVARGDVPDVLNMRARLEALVPALAEERGRPPVVVPVLLTPRTAGAGQVSQLRTVLADSEVAPCIADMGFIAWDPAGVELLEAGETGEKTLGRRPLLRSAQVLAGQLDAVSRTQGVRFERTGATR